MSQTEGEHQGLAWGWGWGQGLDLGLGLSGKGLVMGYGEVLGLRLCYCHLLWMVKG